MSVVRFEGRQWLASRLSVGKVAPLPCAHETPDGHGRQLVRLMASAEYSYAGQMASTCFANGSNPLLAPPASFTLTWYSPSCVSDTSTL